MTVRVDFKTQYANEVSDVKLIVDIPEGCELITNSVVTGTKALPHTLIGNQLTITLSQEDIDSRIRFCITPKTNGIFASTAYTEFNCRGEKRQSIGTAVFEATAGFIAVPSKTASKTVSVNGIAASHATVDVYDDDQLIGSTTALGDGKWRSDVELYKAYNLSTHQIYAKYQTADGIKATTETQESYYDMNQVMAKSVTMINTAHRSSITPCEFVTVFDFETRTTSANSYNYWPSYPYFTFIADLTTNDTTTVRGVTFFVHTLRQEVRKLKGFFDETLGRWVAVSKFDSFNLPVNLSVDVETMSGTVIGDRACLNDLLSTVSEEFEDQKKDVEEIDSLLCEDFVDEYAPLRNELETLLSSEVIDEGAINNIVSQIMESLDEYEAEEIDIEKLEEAYELSEKNFNAWMSAYRSNGKDSFYEDFLINKNILDLGMPQIPWTGTIRVNGIDYIYSMEQLASINKEELIQCGFTVLKMDDGSELYILYGENETSFVDSNTKVKYTLTENNGASSRKAYDWSWNVGESFAEGTLPFAGCLSSLATVIANMRNSNEHSQLRDEIKLVMDLIQCFYETAITWVDNRLNGAYLTRIAQLDKEIAECEGVAKTAGKKMLSDLDYWRQLRSGNADLAAIKEAARNALANSLKTTMKKSELKVLNAQKAALKKAFQIIFAPFEKLPKVLTAGTKLGTVLKVSGKLIGAFGTFIEAISWWEDLQDAYADLGDWDELRTQSERKKESPCNADAATVNELLNNIQRDKKGLENNYVRVILAEYSAFSIDVGSLFVFNCPQAELYLWIASGALNGYATISKTYSINGKYNDLQRNYWLDLRKIKCKEEDDDDDDDDKNTNKPPFDPIFPLIDPSGYVYEAVPTNRVKGVTATIYFDQENPTLWDAADFSQVNPQVTDETGLYQWDVPQGMWQVRFEKAGYETTQTDWLPVPPPQLEINIPMSEAVAPTVVKALGMESGITLDFSKYMKPATLEKSGRVSATVNGKNASGNVEMLNLEEDPYNNKEYASKVKFVPSTAFKTTDEVFITVKKEAESYADKQMDADFVAKVKIEPEIKGFACDSIVAVDYQGSGVLEIAVLPAAAAKGRTVSVSSTSTMIATTDEQSVTLNDEGKATITVNGNLPGGTSLHLQLDGMDIEKYVEVSVVLRETAVKTPKASKRSGSTIEADYLLWLTCNTPGATIYYTLDGSCPCDETKRIKYTGPFMLPAGEVTLKAVAVRQGMEDSEVVTYTYIVESPQVIVNVKNDQNLPVNATYAEGVLTIIGAEGCTVRIFDLLGRELDSRQNAGNTVSMKVPQAESYIVSVTNKDGQTVVRKVSR